MNPPLSSSLKMSFPCGYRFEVRDVIIKELEMPLCPLHEKDCVKKKSFKGSFRVSVKKRVKNPVKKVAKKTTKKKVKNK